MRGLGEKTTIHEDYFGYQEDAERRYGRNSIVLYENGSFYEVYGVENEQERIGQARRISEILNIVCTRKNKKIVENNRSNPLLVGVPSHAIGKYLQVLIQNGFTVVFVEQVTEPPNCKRELTHVISPGTYLSDTVRPDYNFVVCVYGEPWVSWGDATQGTKCLLKKEAKEAKWMGVSQPNGTVKRVNGETPWTIGITAIDTTTGKVFIVPMQTGRSTNAVDMMEELYRVLETLDPREIVWAISEQSPFTQCDMERDLELHRRINHWISPDGSPFKAISAQNLLLSKVYHKVCETTVGASPIERLNLEQWPEIVMSLCLNLTFIQEHDLKLLQAIQIPQQWEPTTTSKEEEHMNTSSSILMRLHHNALYQLNVIPNPTVDIVSMGNDSGVRSLWDLVNHTRTPMGRRLLRERLLHPILSATELEKRYGWLHRWLQLPREMQGHFSKLLTGVGDLERWLRRFQLGTLHPHEFVVWHIALQSAIAIVEDTRFEWEAWGLSTEMFTSIKQWVEKIEEQLNLGECAKYTIHAIQGNIFQPGYDTTMDQKQAEWNGQWNMLEKHVNILGKASGAPMGQEGDYAKLESNERDGYYITLTTRRKNVAVENLRASKSVGGDMGGYEWKALPASGVRCNHPEIQGASNQLIRLRDEFMTEGRKRYGEWMQREAGIIHEWMGCLAHAIAEFDVAQSYGMACVRYGYVRPEIVKERDGRPVLEIRQLRHPIIEQIQTMEKYVPNDVELEGGGCLVFGLNGGGKSSYLKAVGCAVLLAQIGMYVPAESMKWTPVDAIYTRIMGNDNLLKGQSSFMVEMQELRTIMANATKRSLILGDEICRGTEVDSAVALVGATVERLVHGGMNFIFATHLHMLRELDCLRNLERLDWKHVVVEEVNGELIFGRQLRPGCGPSRYGLEVAQWILQDDALLAKAFEIRKSRSSSSLEVEEETGVIVQRTDTSLQETTPPSMEIVTVSSSLPSLKAEKRLEQKVIMKGTVYNGDVWVCECAICGRTVQNEIEAERDFDVHHIDFQCRSDDWGRIGTTPKNHMSNLVVLCKEDHRRVHEGHIKINGWKRTAGKMYLNWMEINAEDNPDGPQRKWTEEMIDDIKIYKPYYGKITVDALIAKIYTEKEIRVSGGTLRQLWGTPPEKPIRSRKK